MKFEDVEDDRKMLNAKRAKLKKKAIKIVASIELPLLVLCIVMNYENFFGKSGLLNSELIIHIIPSLIAILFMLIIPVIIAIIIVSVLTSKEFLQYKKAYKAYFVEQALNNTFTDIKYNHEAGLDSAILASTGMINTGDRYSSNDLTVGKHNDVGFIQADVHIEEEEEERDSDGNIERDYYTIFRGRFMIFEFPKKFHSRVLVKSRYAEYLIAATKNGRKMEYIETESVDFNKLFNVYAEDGLDAFYVLTPDFMEKVQKLSQLYDNNISFCFTENRMIVGINDGGDAFEPPDPRQPLDESAESAKIHKETDLIISIVDELKLSRR